MFSERYSCDMNMDCNVRWRDICGQVSLLYTLSASIIHIYASQLINYETNNKTPSIYLSQVAPAAVYISIAHPQAWSHRTLASHPNINMQPQVLYLLMPVVARPTRGSEAALLFQLRVRIPTGVFMSVVSVVCCQTEVFAKDRSLFQRNPFECVCVFVRVIEDHQSQHWPATPIMIGIRSQSETGVLQLIAWIRVIWIAQKNTQNAVQQFVLY